MKNYLIDSDVLIDLFKKKTEALQLIKDLGEIGRTSISPISVAELRSGWDENEAKERLPHLYAIFDVIPLTKDIAEVAGKYRESYSRQGIRLPTMDVLIAATAITHTCCLVTRNIKHYPMPDIEIYPDIYGMPSK